jgi:hypothetical protein
MATGRRKSQWRIEEEPDGPPTLPNAGRESAPHWVSAAAWSLYELPGRREFVLRHDSRCFPKQADFPTLESLRQRKLR